jgi:small subunit ribosomal protein S6
MKRKFETLVLFRPDAPAEKMQAIFDKIEKVINDNDGNILDIDHWGKKKLAYEVQKHSKGIYTLYNYLAPNVLIAELERNLRLSLEVMKFLTIKLEDLVDVDLELTQAQDRQKAKEEEEERKKAEQAAAAEKLAIAQAETVKEASAKEAKEAKEAEAKAKKAAEEAAEKAAEVTEEKPEEATEAPVVEEAAAETTEEAEATEATEAADDKENKTE